MAQPWLGSPKINALEGWMGGRMEWMELGVSYGRPKADVAEGRQLSRSDSNGAKRRQITESD